MFVCMYACIYAYANERVFTYVYSYNAEQKALKAQFLSSVNESLNDESPLLVAKTHTSQQVHMHAYTCIHVC